MAKTKIKGPEWIENTQTIEGVKWLRGFGTLPSDFLLIASHPGIEEVKSGTVFTGPSGKLLFEIMRKVSFEYMRPNSSEYNIYMTNAVKYLPLAGKKVNAHDLAVCAPLLQEEIKRCKPKVIICLGAPALKAVLGNGHTLSTYKGSFVKHPELPNVEVFTTYNPAYILRNPEAAEEYERDWKLLTERQSGKIRKLDVTDYTVINSVAKLQAFKTALFEKYDNPMLVIDCEWNGATWMSKDRYIRTIQIGSSVGKAVVVEFYSEGVVPEGKTWEPKYKKDEMDDHDTAWKIIKEILEDPRVTLTGHNIIADGEWLLSYDIDVRPRTIFDTMLAEHVINGVGPFSLDNMTVKYTSMGHYDLEVKEWVKLHKEICAHGFGPVPRDLLLPYGAKDVDAPRRIISSQIPKLIPYMEPRGKYPSLWDIEMATAQAIYELETTGILVDPKRLESLTLAYKNVLSDLANQLQIIVTHEGVENFNFRSPIQVAHVMFDILELQPIKTTKNQPWAEFMRNQSPEAQKLYAPSTDMNTLEILQEKHPFVKLMMHIRRIDTVRKYWLRDKVETFDEATKEGGIIAKIWVDGKLHPHFSQLAETGRFRHSKPNIANWPKKSEGYVKKAFESVNKPMPQIIRTIAIPMPGKVFMEGDFRQAELWALARLSNDTNMIRLLATPGMDLHDSTAIDSFHLTVLGSDGKPIQNEYILELAKTMSKEDLDVWKNQLSYRDLRGNILSRQAFKAGIRISAKNLGFGIPYGRGPQSIARQIKGETGSDRPLAEIEEEVQHMMETWKTTSFPAAWAYMCACGDAVENPGYLENPWGRKRIFPVIPNKDRLAGIRREAQNFNLQSTVADTCSLAMYLMRGYRIEHNLHFRFSNQLHDAIMLELPENEIDKTKIMFKETMGNIDIPITGQKPLRLAVDIDTMTRWGEKIKEN